MDSDGFEIPEGLFCYDVNGSCPKSIRPNSKRIPIYAAIGGTILITVCGNLVVIISIAHFKQLHTPTNFLVMSMAVVDLLLGSMVMPYSMVRSVENCWYFGDIFCKVHSSTDMMLCTASILHLCFVAVDRYYAVCNPLQYKAKITGFVVMMMITISWMLPAVVSFAVIFLGLHMKGVEEFYNNHTKCTGGCVLFLNEASLVFGSMISFYVPGVIMVCIYGKIYLIASKQARAIKGVANKAKEASRSRISRNRERKAAKTLGIVMGDFLLCWFPYLFCNIMDPFLNYRTPPVLFEVLVWFAYLNSTFNPIMYGFFYIWFREALKIILFGKGFQCGSSTINLFSD
uniref:Trace amine-associated receptor 1 n=1 Tax=Latimeria chalumnae TaxID=7897 RepID=H3AB64_LATCH|nr:PREDICTED: trace amine-associated receptor 1-like [Latimeria chalumnae]|eukprot:XP_006010958.1 PREDICTED: trace amine-associated receptor 1-like [Latimeria chalumnae]